MALPVWMQNEAAGWVLGVSLVFVLSAWVMHRVFVRVLKTPAPADSTHAPPP